MKRINKKVVHIVTLAILSIFTIFSFNLYYNGFNNSPKTCRKTLSRPFQKLVRQKICKRQKLNIFFLKTHKTGGTSVQNFLLRHAYSNNLKIAIPIQNHLFNLSMPFNRTMVYNPGQHIKRYNTIFHHMIYNRPEIEAILPPNAFYVTILRDPVAEYESIFNYFPQENKSYISLEEYVMTDYAPYRLPEEQVGINQQMYVLGLKITLDKNITEIQKKVRQVEKDFQFVMITEYFDESLILLKEMLCWSTDDVISLRLNARKTTQLSSLSKEIKSRIRYINMADQLLYNHFLDIFKKKMKQFGYFRMKKEIKFLRKRQKWWFNYCVGVVVDNGKELEYPYKTAVADIIAYKPKKDNPDTICELFMYNEIVMHLKLKSKINNKYMANEAAKRTE